LLLEVISRRTALGQTAFCALLALLASYLATLMKLFPIELYP
jgi:hypothetical protein